MKRGPRAFYGWVVLSLAFLCILLGAAVFNSFQLFFVALLTDPDFERSTRAALSLVSSITFIVYGTSSPLVGRLTDRVGPRVVIPIGGTLMGIGLLASSTATGIWQLCIFYGAVTGLGLGLIDMVPNTAVLSNWFVKRRGMAMGIAGAGSGAAVFILVPAIQQLISSFGWRTTYVVMGLFILATIPVLNGLFQRHRPQDIGLLPDGARSEAECTVAGSCAPSGIEWTLHAALRTRSFWLLAAANALIPFASQVVLVHQVAYMVDHGFDPLVAASVSVPMGLAGITGRTLLTGFSDRLGRLRCYTFSVACLVLAVGFLIASSSVASVWVLYVYGFLMGLGFLSKMPLISAISADLFQGQNFATIYGFARIGGGIFGALGPLVAGLVFDLSGSYVVAFASAAFADVASLACVALAVVTPRLIAEARRAS